MVSEAMTKWMGGFLVFALGCGSAFGEGESPKVLPLPPLVIETPWLQERQEKQLATVEQFQVFHDFRFTDEVVASGITFRHKVVDDAGRNYKAVHYDHGNGLAVADVDGDGQVNPVDSGIVQANFGSTDEQALCNYDVDCDGQINPVDAGIIQSLFGTCRQPRESCP